MLNPFDRAQGKLREASGPRRRCWHRTVGRMRWPDPSLPLRARPEHSRRDDSRHMTGDRALGPPRQKRRDAARRLAVAVKSDPLFAREILGQRRLHGLDDTGRLGTGQPVPAGINQFGQSGRFAK